MSDPSPPTAGVRRNTEIEEATNLYFIHPISSWLVPVFARLGIHPNTVSWSGAISGMLGAVAYYFSQAGDGLVFAGFGLMVLWHIFDGADGQLARLTGKVTTSGFVIDGVCDYLTFGAIYTAILLKLWPTYGWSAVALFVFAATSHALQSAAFERQRESYIHWTSKVVSMTPAQIEKARADAKANPPSSSTLRGFMAYYDMIQRPFLPIPVEAEHWMQARVLEGHAPEVSALYRGIYRPAVLMWSLLSANNRTLIIFLAFLAGSPQGYPWFEIVVLNVALAMLVGMNAALGRRLTRSQAATA